MLQAAGCSSETLWTEIKQQALTVWLTVPVEVLVERIKAGQLVSDSRPSLTGKGTVEAYVSVHKKREILYGQMADLIIDTALLDRAHVVTDIVSYVR